MDRGRGHLPQQGHLPQRLHAAGPAHAAALADQVSSVNARALPTSLNLHPSWHMPPSTSH
eukprot:366061-Chlamydomonas_euryale.AAC.15